MTNENFRIYFYFFNKIKYSILPIQYLISNIICNHLNVSLEITQCLQQVVVLYILRIHLQFVCHILFITCMCLCLSVAQLAARQSHNLKVVSSILTQCTTFCIYLCCFTLFAMYRWE